MIKRVTKKQNLKNKRGRRRIFGGFRVTGKMIFGTGTTDFQARNERKYEVLDGSVLNSPIPCTRKVSARQIYKGLSHSFVTVLNKDDPSAETLRAPGIGLLRTGPKFRLIGSRSHFSPF